MAVDMDGFAAEIEHPMSGQNSIRRIPQADGFALALERHLASGGGMRMGGRSRKAGFRFTEGKLRGLTVEQATQQARDLWDKAPASVKEKYSQRATTGVLAPSERMAATVERPSIAAQPSITDGGGVQLPDGRTYVPGRGIDLGNGVFQKVSMPQYEAGGRPAVAPGRAENDRAFRAELGLPAPVAKPEFGATAMTPATGQRNVASTDRPVNPGVVAAPIEKAWVGTPAERSPAMKAALPKPAEYSGEKMTGSPDLPGKMTPAPSRSRAIAAGAVERPAMAATLGKKINPLTGKPMGWLPSDNAPVLPKSTGYAGPRPGAGRYDPDLGFVPTATPVAEAPMGQQEYDTLGKSIKADIEPGSPEMSAALGRRRQFEDQQTQAKAAPAQRERLGPSFAERDAADRKARRALDRRVMEPWGMQS
jgi:hypothetical protein